jgi:O-antigen/teichoic acid export membrane protein
MLHRVRRLMPKSSFLRKLSVLASGSIAGQSLVILSSPLLTRFFSPEEFGTFAVFVALIGIIGAVLALGFDIAIAAVRDDSEAAMMIFAAVSISVIFSSILLFIIWSFGHSLAMALDMPALSPLLWLIGPAALVWGIGNALGYWSIRHGRYRSNAVNRTLQLGTQAGSQVALGFLQTGAPGLIAGYLLGYTVRLGHYAWNLPRGDFRWLAQPRWGLLFKAMKDNWRYPVYVVPSTFLQTSCQLAPALLIAALYGPATAGLYALSQRIIGLPVQMLGQAASKVFLGEARDLRSGPLLQYFKRTASLFVILAVIGAAAIIPFTPFAFDVVFGSEWREAGVFIQLLAHLYLVRFIVKPTSQILYIIKRQDFYFMASLINVAALVISFGCAYFFALPVHITILAFSVTSSSSLIFTFARAWMFLREMERLERLESSDGRTLSEAGISRASEG